MDHETYRQRCLELSERHESGDWAGAAAGWRELLDRPGIPEIDRIVLIHNLAITVAQGGQVEQAEDLFQQAIDRERPLMRGLARAGRADWLVRQGRPLEAVPLLEELAAEPWATWGEIEGWQRLAADLRSNPQPQTTAQDGAPQQDTEPRTTWQKVRRSLRGSDRT